MYNFHEVLSDSVRVGHIFVISGYSARFANSLKILLACGKAENSNVALSLETKFADRKIIRSAFVGGNFVNEECDSENSNLSNLSYENSMPLRPGEQFTFCILVGDDRFHIAVNDASYCQYKYQTSPEQIRSIMIYGDMDALVKVNHLKMFPFIYPNIQSDYEDLAFESFIPKQYGPGHLTLITGTVNGKSDGEFIIMFTQDETKRQLIHFNVRFDETAVVMNTMDAEEGWSDNEIRTMDFPFVIGEKFKLAFAFTEHELKVAVNGSQLIQYPLHHIEMDDDENLWAELTGFRVKNGIDMLTKITDVEHIKMNDQNCEDFEEYCAL
ncbi:unnamed protein product [Chironomus riparius]|uniref:Galectin n=1 Tax=Chironomus riparius TaxID=315576 RepID=A0A9N9WY72_9DIPT|nr:unnamed protein product [Chironomus riparius]